MKKILLITHYTPTKDNYNGPSALMYHLLKNREPDVELKVFSFNRNLVSNKATDESARNLNAEIILIKRNLTNILLTTNRFAHLLKTLRVRKLSADCYFSLPSEIIKSIDAYNPQLVFIYPHTNLKIAKQLSKYKIIVCGPDCASLHYSRLLRDLYCFRHGNIKNQICTYYNRLLLEQEWCKINNAFLYLVGQTDCNYFNIINDCTKAYFFPHPHYELVNKNISLQRKQIKILISGKYDLYTYTDITNLVTTLENSSNEFNLKEKYSFTFLGKGWNTLVKRLLQVNYDVYHTYWVDDYTNYISQFDIQIFPISVGSGTKGKVLDALSTGILCIGSKYAFENIAVQNLHSCIVYDNVNEIPSVLNDIFNNQHKYETIANNGKESVRTKHAPKNIINSLIRFASTGEYEYKFNTKDYLKLELK